MDDSTASDRFCLILLGFFAGLAAGLLADAAGVRILESLLYQVEPLDPVTFAAVPFLLLAVTLLAMALPARAATRISPTEAMRVD